MKINKRTKIITTIGPKSESEEMMEKLFLAGMDTIRLNFSHGSFAEHSNRISIARKISEKYNRSISIMLDTKGPEIRIGKQKKGSSKVTKNSLVKIYMDKNSYSKKEFGENEFAVSFDFSKDIKIGKSILVDDGKLELIVEKIEGKIILARAVNSFVIKTNKRVNLPGTKYSMPFLSKNDVKDIEFGIKNNVDFIAASFTNTASDIKDIKAILESKNATNIRIFAKIESQYAVDHFDAIAKEADGVMIARGDLGLEIPYYDVPVAQKMMIRKMRELGKPVIVATQMLDSMETRPLPTRAEVTDVYYATELGADATMLSGESAAGSYPVESVQVMSNINIRAEKEFYNDEYYKKYLKTLPKGKSKREIHAQKITQAAKKGEYKYVVVRSKTGKLLSEIAKLRPNTLIIGILKDEELFGKFGVTSSVYVYPSKESYLSIKKNHENARIALEVFDIKPGDKFLVADNSGITKHKF